MTPQELLYQIQRLPAFCSVTDAFEHILSRKKIWSRKGVHYASQKEHWLGWLRGYKGPGYYERKNWRRSAEFAYNHIVCPPMLVWLAEAAGVQKQTLLEARDAALSARPTLPSLCAAIRKVIPWQTIEPCLSEWAWRKRSVDPSKGHFELRYGSAEEGGWNDWMPVARVGRPIKRVFSVDFIINRKDPHFKVMMEKAIEELDFYLVQLHEDDPWAYAKYHCGTTANVYSSVHWNYLSGKGTPNRRT